MIALDFDGVIADTLEQIAIDAYNAYKTIFKIKKPSLTLKDYRKTITPSFMEGFRSMMSFSRAPGHVVAIIHAMEHQAIIADQKDFDRYLEHLPHKDWADELFRQRYIFQKQEGWQDMVHPFPGVVAFMKLKKAAILTNKDRKTVKLILDHFNVSFQESHIYGKDISTDKREKLGLIAKDFSCEISGITVIDDNLANLIELKGLGARCFLASWGYNNEKQRKEARKHNIQVIAMKDLEFI